MLSTLLKRVPSRSGVLPGFFEENPSDSAIRRQVWMIAWPSVVAFTLMTFNGILDRAFVGSLGPVALAAVGVGIQMLYLMVSVTMAIGAGATALVARFTGERDADQAKQATGQSIALSLALGAASWIVARLLLEPILTALNLEEEARAACRVFLTTALWGVIPLFAGAALGAALRGVGDSQTPMRAMIIAIAVHLALDYSLIFGKLGAPKLGVLGSGIAWAASHYVMAAVLLLALPKTPLAGALSTARLRISVDWAKRILSVGIPASVTALLRTGSLMAFTGVLSRTSEATLAVAALPIGMAAEAIAFMPGFGFGVAAQSLVGQALGAKQPELAVKIGWTATLQAIWIMSIMGMLFFVFAEPYGRFFTGDAQVLALTTPYLHIMALTQPLLAMGLVLTQAMQGAGDTMRPTLVTVISFWLVRQPLAWILAITAGYQTLGAWWAMAIGTMLNGLLTAALFRQGAWKRARI